MTRTGLSPRLGSHLPDPFVEVNPDDAAKIGLERRRFCQGAHGAWERGSSRQYHFQAKSQAGSLFLFIGTTRLRDVPGSGALIHPITDPHSGQPDSKAVPSALTPMSFAAYGFVLSRARTPLAGDTVFAWSAIEGGYAARFATNEPFKTVFEALADRSRGTEQTTYIDPSRGIFRAALIQRDRLETVVFLAGAKTFPLTAFLPKPGRLNASMQQRAAFSFQAGPRPRASMQVPRSARASA